MVITINGSTFTLDLDTILIWALVGLVAGFLASHIALGHGLGLLGDIIVGIIGAFPNAWEQFASRRSSPVVSPGPIPRRRASH